MIEVRRIQPDEGAAIRKLRIAALTDTPEAFGATLAEEQATTVDMHHALAADRAPL